MTSVMPSGWKESELSELGKCIRGVSYNPEVDLRERDSADSVRLLRSNNVQEGTLDLTSLQFVSKVRVSPQQNMSSGDILICMANGSKQLVGKAARFEIRREHPYTFGAFMGIFRPFDKTDSDFIYFLMQSKEYRTYLDIALSGSSINNLRPSNILEMVFVIPEQDERKRISNALVDLDLFVRELDKLIAKKREIKQGAMQQLLTGKKRLPRFDVKETAQDLLGVKKGLPMGWSEVKVSAVLQRVKDLPRSVATSDFLSRGLLPIVDQGKELVSGFTNDQNFQIDCPSGGYVVFGDHTRVVKYIDFNFATGADGTQVLEPKIPVNAKFISYSIQSREIPNTGYNRHFKYLAELEILLPGLEEQRAIAQILSEMDAEIDALVAQREKTALIKTGMMQELLTGRTRLL